MLVKAFLLVDLVGLSTVGIAGAVTIDSSAEKIILYGGALAALGIIWRSFIRPASKIIHRTVTAVDALESLPGWRRAHDEHLADVEAELAITQASVGEVGQRVDVVQNDVSAIRRKLGIGDEDVRRLRVEPEVHPPAAAAAAPASPPPLRRRRRLLEEDDVGGELERDDRPRP